MALTEADVRRIVRDEVNTMAGEVAEALMPLLELPEAGDISTVLNALFGIDGSEAA